MYSNGLNVYLESTKSELRYKSNKYYENLIVMLANSMVNLNVILMWSPGLCGIIENVKADEAAKLARQCNDVLCIKIPTNELRKHVEKAMWEKWNIQYWNTPKGMSFKNIFTDNLQKKTWFLNTELGAGDIKVMNRPYAGHAYDKEFLRLMNKTDSNLCEVCNVLDNYEHMILKCEKHKAIRKQYQELESVSSMQELLMNKDKL